MTKMMFGKKELIIKDTPSRYKGTNCNRKENTMSKTALEIKIRKAAEKRFQKYYTDAMSAVYHNPILKRLTVIRFCEDVNLDRSLGADSALAKKHYMSDKTNFDEVREQVIADLEKDELRIILEKIDSVTIPKDKSFEDFVERTLRRICATLDIPFELCRTSEERRKH